MFRIVVANDRLII